MGMWRACNDRQLYFFPPKQELKLKLKDMLEDEVDKKYYLSEKAIQGRLITNYQKYKLEENIINDKEVHSTILARFDGAPTLVVDNSTNTNIRKLTPKECWRLMGFDDEDVDKASEVNSNTQLYKQAGNSIVVNVLEAIFKELFRVGD